MKSFAHLNRVALATALACAAASGSAMDLSQAYQAALEQDAQIRASRATADQGRELLPQARAQLMPSLQASASRMNNRLQSTTPNFNGQLSTSQDNYASTNKTFTVRQPLYRPYNMALYRQAQAQVDDANATLEKDLQNLASRVGGAYFEALLAEDQLSLVGAQKAFYATQVDASRKALAAGSGIRTDIDDAQARLDLATAQELEARQNVDYTRRELQVLVNQPVDKLARVDTNRMQLILPNPERIEDWMAMAELTSPEIMSAKAQVEIARQEVDKAKAGHMPTLDAIAQWSRSGSENLISIHSAYDTKAVGIQFSMSLFAGGYVNSQIRQALAGQERAEQALEAIRRDLGVRVYAQFRGVTEGVLKVRAYEQAVRSADQLVDSMRKAFQAGSRTQVDILNAEQQRMSSRRDLANARYLYLISRVRLLALAGGDKIQEIAQINGWLQPQ